MAEVYYDQNVEEGVLLDKKVAVIGYGSQGHAHAKNLRDSGVKVFIGIREGKSKEQAKEDGFKVMPVETAVAEAEVVILLLPDEIQAEVYESCIKDILNPGSFLGFAHGFNLQYEQIKPEETINTFLVAPKGPGHIVRQAFEDGGGVPALVAVDQNPSGETEKLALAYAKLIGAGRAGIMEASVKEETETDLFGEQAVLCGGMSALVKAGFETLVEAGYQPEVAYFECLHEVKLVVDLMYENGLEGMRYSISDTAEWGAYKSGPRIVNEDTKSNMRDVLSDIQNGSFAKQWIAENENGRASFRAYAKKEEEHQITKVGRDLRALMPFVKKHASLSQ
ncbi:ketol-acid reductoisomerase [Halobacillus litoralis]|uniref:ketol-acid reductoisomerase n=1 Tax=Halobacillus litoralis TaxID=45668 RepID=UPI00248FE702|nr:ketol-acid reductoisomerase [Halobacillus litoralis]